MSQKKYPAIPAAPLGYLCAALTAMVLLVCVCFTEIVVLAAVNPETNHGWPHTTGTAAPGTTDKTAPGTADKTAPYTDVTPPVPSGARLAKTEDYGDSYIDKIIFLGDSTTYGLKSYGLLKDGVESKQFWTGIYNGNKVGTLSLQGDMTKIKIRYPDSGENITIVEAVKRKKPEYMVITLGINHGVPGCEEKEFKAIYGKLLKAIKEESPHTKVMLQSIFPVNPDIEGYKENKYGEKGFTNEKIDLCNKWIEELAEDHGMKYLHTNQALKDSDGKLHALFCGSGDGMHMTVSGLREVLAYIRTHGYPSD